VHNLLVHPMPIPAEGLMTAVNKLLRRDLFGAQGGGVVVGIQAHDGARGADRR